MRKILLDPNKNFYKANMHCHSTYSDGIQTVSELKKEYLKQGYSIVAFTDHEHLIDNSWLNDESFLAITSCELAIKEFENLSTLVKTDMKVCHLNLYSLNEHNIKTPCYNSVYDKYTEGSLDKISIPSQSFPREYSHKGVNEIIKIANEQGFLVSYNHPKWSLEDARDYLGYEGLWAVEIFNTSCWREGLFEYNINVYDDFLRDGHKMACVAGDDNHSLKNCFGGYTMINAERLEYNTVMEALKNNNFYASTGPEIIYLYLENDMAYISAREGEYVILSTGTRRAERKEIPTNGLVSFKFNKNDKYIRFDVVGKNGARANTCAYFI